MSTVSRAKAINRPADRHTQSAGRAHMGTANSTRRRSYLSDLRTATLEPSDKPLPASGDCTLPKLTGETAQTPNGEDAWSFRDADRVPFDETLSTANRGAIVALATWPLSWPRASRAFRRAWR